MMLFDRVEGKRGCADLFLWRTYVCIRLSKQNIVLL